MERSILEARAPRSALMKLLDSHIEKRVVFLYAPAGFGKTVSAQLWLSHREKCANVRHKTVSLDEYDNNAFGFCRRFVSALVSLQPNNQVLRELTENPAFASAPVEFALRSLSVFTEEQIKCFLVFDDMHVITNHETLRLLSIFINRLTANFTVLLLSRAAPPDNFSEMELKDELVIVDSTHLQFTNEEIRAFFHNNRIYITKKQTDEIFESTGGWAIGIRTLLLSNEQPYDFKLTRQHLDSFLRKHIWERWSVQQRRFMMLVSVVEELTSELCEWLTVHDDILKTVSGEEMLTSLADEKAYLRITGSKTYRFHDLFRDFLLQILKDNSDGAALRQLSKAGDYYYNQKDYHRAVEYYIRSANEEGLINTINCLYDYNCVGASVKDTLNTIHLLIHNPTLDSIFKKEPLLSEAIYWAAFVEGRADEFEKYADHYYRMYPNISSRDRRSGIIFAFLHCIDYRIGLIEAFEIVSDLTSSRDVKAASPTLTHNLPFFHRSNRDFSEVLLDPERNMIAADNSIGLLIGKEYAVLKECLLSGFSYERGYMSEACEHAIRACSNITDDCSAEIRFCAMMMLASVLAAADNKKELTVVLDKVEDMIDQKNAYYLNANLRAFKCGLRLADGDETAALEWINDSTTDLFEDLSFFGIYQHFTTARAYITVGNYTNAALVLQKLLKLSERYRRPLDIIESHILLAIVYRKKIRNGQPIALNHLRQAVAVAIEYGYTQMFESEGAELVNLFSRLQKSTAQNNSVKKSTQSFIRSLYIAAAAGAKRHKGLTGRKSPVNMAFTDKQKTVMRLMSDGLNRNDIAAKMGITPYAVKSHVELIYKKLDVSNRTDAVIRIRKFGVLESSQE